MALVRQIARVAPIAVGTVIRCQKTRITPLPLLVLLLLCRFSPTGLATSTESLGTYCHHLRSVLVLLNRLHQLADQDPTLIRQGLKQGLASLPSQVTMPDGQGVRLQPIGSAFAQEVSQESGRKLEKRIEFVTRIVAVRLQEAESVLSLPPIKSPAEIRNLTRGILDRPEFKKSLRIEWLQRMIEWMADHLPGLPLLDNRSFPVIYWLVLILCSAALLTASIYLLRHLWLPSDRPASKSLNQTNVLPVNLLAHQDYLSQASQAASKEDFVTALRWLLVALIAFLDEKRIVIYQPGRTNWFYVRSCSSNPQWSHSAQALATLFDRKWYGSEPCSEQEYQEGQKALLQVIGTEETP